LNVVAVNPKYNLSKVEHVTKLLVNIKMTLKCYKCDKWL